MLPRRLDGAIGGPRSWLVAAAVTGAMAANAIVGWLVWYPLAFYVALAVPVLATFAHLFAQRRRPRRLRTSTLALALAVALPVALDANLAFATVPLAVGFVVARWWLLLVVAELTMLSFGLLLVVAAPTAALLSAGILLGRRADRQASSSARSSSGSATGRRHAKFSQT